MAHMMDAMSSCVPEIVSRLRAWMARTQGGRVLADSACAGMGSGALGRSTFAGLATELAVAGAVCSWDAIAERMHVPVEDDEHVFMYLRLPANLHYPMPLPTRRAQIWRTEVLLYIV